MSITLIIIIITVIVSVIANNNGEMKSKMLFNAYQVIHRREYYRIFSHALIHSGWMHLGVNMWVLYVFGNYVEGVFVQDFPNNGKMSFIVLYIGGVIFASFSALYRHKDNPGYNSLGASGAVSAVLYSYIIINPTNLIYLYFAFGIPAFIFGILYLWYEYTMDKRSGGRIAHDAHFLGAVFGVIYTLSLDFDYLTSFIYEIKNFVEINLLN